MSNASGTRTTARAPRRHTGLGDFFIRLWTEKPLGSACGIIVLLLIVVAVFADVLAPMAIRKYTWQTGCRAHRPGICWVPTSWGETT